MKYFLCFITLMLSVARLCAENALPPEYYAVAHYSGVPADVLFAVALAESGRGAGAARAPYPWTLNIAGEPHYYDSRQAMFDALLNALQQGQTNVDIGPLQLNWHWQHRRLISPWKATELLYNLKTAADILAKHYARERDWGVAIGKYHRAASGAKHRAAANAYSARVGRILERLQ